MSTEDTAARRPSNAEDPPMTNEEPTAQSNAPESPAKDSPRSRTPSSARSRRSSSAGSPRTPSPQNSQPATPKDGSRPRTPHDGSRSPTPIDSRSPTPSSRSSSPRSPTAVDDAEPDRYALSLECVLTRNLQRLQDTVPMSGPFNKELFAMVHTHDGRKSTLVTHAAYLGRKDCLRYLAKCEGYNAEACGTLFTMLDYQRYETVLFLLSIHPRSKIVNAQRASDGNTLIHVACMRRKPNIEFLAALARIEGVNPNIRNAKGDTPLHLVATHSTSAEGREAAKVLLKMGADVSIVNANDRTATSVATNPFVREVLGLATAPRRRELPDLDETSRAEVDTCSDLVRLPSLKVAQVEPDKKRQSRSPVKGKAKVLGQEGVDSLVDRLFAQTLRKKEAWRSDVVSKLETSRAPSRQLTQEEQDAAVTRLYDASLQLKEERMVEMTAKYIPEPPEAKTLSPSAIEESAHRLSKASVDALDQSRQTLAKKYASPKKSKKLTKEECAASAARLHDESVSKTSTKLAELFDRFTAPEKGRFSGHTKLSMDGWKEMGNRLCTAKK